MLDPIKKAELHVSGSPIPHKGASKKEKKESKVAHLRMELAKDISIKTFLGSTNHPNEIVKSLQKELPKFLFHLNARPPKM